jgi:hypothetical protein
MTGPGNRREAGRNGPRSSPDVEAADQPRRRHHTLGEFALMGSVIKKRRKRMAKKKHRKLLRKTRVARRKAGK